MRNVLQTLLYVIVGQRVIAQIAVDIVVVGRHVDKAMSAEIEQYHLFLSLFFALLRLTDGSCNGMTAFGCRNNTLGTGKEHASSCL